MLIVRFVRRTEVLADVSLEIRPFKGDVFVIDGERYVVSLVEIEVDEEKPITRILARCE